MLINIHSTSLLQFEKNFKSTNQNQFISKFKRSPRHHILRNIKLLQQNHRGFYPKFYPTKIHFFSF